MKRVHMFLAGGAVIALLAGIFVLWSPGPSEPASSPGYLDKAGGEILLPPNGREEILRRVLYGPDGFTRQRLVVYFRNGDTGVTIFHQDGSLDVYRFHPSEKQIDWKASALQTTGVKSLIKIGIDGRTLRAEQHWDDAGKLKKLGQRLPAGGYQTEAFYGDGSELAERSLFNARGVLESRFTYWENGNIRATLKITNSLVRESASFYPDGEKASVHTIEGNIERGEYYFEDGKTVRMKFSKELIWRYYSGYSVVTAVYNNRDGSLSQTRTFELKSMTVVFANNGITPGFSQTWKMIDEKRTENKYAPENFRLELVSVSRFNGHDNVEFAVNKEGVVTEFRFTRKGANGNTEKVTRFLRADGTVEREEVKVGQNINAQNFTGDSGGRVVVPGVFLERGVYELPPATPSETVVPSWYP